MTDDASSAANPQETALVERLRRGEAEALGELFDRYRDRLWRMVRFRMDPRLTARVDPDDILQEAYVNAAARIEHYLVDTSRSLLVWFRLVVGQTMVDVHRRHLGAHMRSVGREVSADGMAYPQATSVALAAELLATVTSPSLAAVRAEVSSQLERAVATMSPLDQEIIALRHFEELTNREVAEVLNISVTAASNRYVRALAKLKEILAGMSL